ncbi:MAG: glycosyltransferase [Gammaproteobacteria bacterium]|nr:glycosyltransferase [Gammaproteobacteria bacterium]
MKILYLSLDPPLNLETVATGNQVRVQGILETLQMAGHDIVQSFPAPDHNTSNFTSDCYRTKDELESFISGKKFDAIVVGYWSLLAHLPDTRLPVILDFIAPRILELMFQDPDSLLEKTAELIETLQRADHFLVGNQRQSDLLLSLLLQAGFDCREQMPVSIVPISTRGETGLSENSSGKLRLINAGVNWPWRNSGTYKNILDKLSGQNERVEFVELTGACPGEGSEADENKTSLLNYAAMQEELQACDIGLELGERNTEREFSHSFRSIEYLQCGLPIIINTWIPLSRQIEKYNAGWVIEEAGELKGIVESILAEPKLLADKKIGMENLIKAELNYGSSCIPLLDYLALPIKAEKKNLQQPKVAAAAESPRLLEFLEKQTEVKSSPVKVFLGAVFKTLFCPSRPESTPDILMVTRSDLFPTDHGAAVKIVRTAESLSRQGRDVWLTTDSRRDYYQFKEGKRKTYRFPFYIRLLCLPRLFAFARLLLKGYPESNHFLYLPVTDISYVVRTIWLASRKPVGAYQAEFPAYVRPCRFARSLFGGKILLVQHNIEYVRIKNQVPELTRKNYFTLKNLEIAMCRLADNIVAVSENDRQKMIEDGIAAEKIHTIPHGVDLQAFRNSSPVDIRMKYGLPAQDKVLVYHGTYSYPPNLEAMEVMAKEILPRLELKGVQVSVLAIGSKAPDFPLHEKIHFVGSIDDLSTVIPAADLAVVPLQDGGGTRMKILDYFAAGVPVISTTKGIEGIPVKHGDEALIINDYDAICNGIEDLLSDNEAAEKLSEAADRFVDSLSWDKIVRRYLPLL